MVRVLSFLLLSSVAFAGGYEKVATKNLFNGEKLLEYRLNNGFRVILVPRHQAKVLTYQTWFHVGSLNEKLDRHLNKTGLAHFFEHMMFRGTEKYPDGVFDQMTARIGGDNQNATTFYYRTNYYESVPSRQLEKIMEMESDRMVNLKLTPEAFEKEKGVVVGEYRRMLDSPPRVAWDELMKLMFEKSPYRWSVLGDEAGIKSFTLENAQYFYRTFYSPNNGVLIVVGDTSEELLLPLVVKYYGEMKAQSVPQLPIPAEPKQTQERRYSGTHRQATSEILFMGYHIPPVSSSDTVPLSLLSTHLSIGMEARLRKLLVDKNIAVMASATVDSQPDAFQLTIHLAEKRKAADALKVVDKEIKSLQERPISRKSFDRALNQELLNLYDDISDNSALGNWLGEFLMTSGNYMRGFEIIEAYKKLKPQDLQRVAKLYLIPANRSIVIIRPEKKEKS